MQTAKQLQDFCQTSVKHRCNIRNGGRLAPIFFIIGTIIPVLHFLIMKYPQHLIHANVMGLSGYLLDDLEGEGDA